MALTRLSLSLALLILGSACAPMRMSLPADFEQKATRLPVTGRNFNLKENLTVGAYAIDDVHRGWKVTDSWSALGFQSVASKDSWEYRVHQAGTPLYAVQCASGTDSTVLKHFLGPVDFGIDERVSLTANLQAPSGQPSWALALTLAKPSQMFSAATLVGVLTDGTRRIDIRGTNKMAGSSLEAGTATGYELSMGGKLVAAIEVTNEGRVLWAPDLADDLQKPIAGAAGALLLYRPPEDE